MLTNRLLESILEVAPLATDDAPFAVGQPARALDDVGERGVLVASLGGGVTSLSRNMSPEPGPRIQGPRNGRGSSSNTCDKGFGPNFGRPTRTEKTTLKKTETLSMRHKNL